MTKDESIHEEIIRRAFIVERAIQGHASTRAAIRWAMQQEREACAKLCDEIAQAKTYQTGYLQETAEECAEAVRARGEK